MSSLDFEMIRSDQIRFDSVRNALVDRQLGCHCDSSTFVRVQFEPLGSPDQIESNGAIGIETDSNDAIGAKKTKRN